MCVPISCIGGQLPEGERTGKAGTHETFDRITQKCRKTKIAGYKSHPATRNWRSAYEFESARHDRNCEIRKLYEKVLAKGLESHYNVVTQTNAVKSPTDSPATTKLVYTVEEIARMLAISLRSSYNLCNSTTEFHVLRAGGSIRIPKDSFDAWLNRAA